MNKLYCSSNIEVKFNRKFYSSSVFITFSHFGDENHAERKGFGEDFFKKNKIDAVHIMCMNNKWYQYEEMDEVINIINREVGQADVITYGSSMGGYAAINFSKKFNAKKVIAISPQFSIDPRLVPFEHRWDSSLPDIIFIDDNISSGNQDAEHYLLYDSADPDRIHAEMIAEHVPSFKIPFRYSGHPTGDFLVETGLLGTIITDIIFSKIDCEEVVRASRNLRKHSSAYFRTIAEILPNRRLSLKIKLIKKSIELRPENKLGHILIIKYLINSGKWQDALVEIDRSRSLGDNSAYLNHLHSVAFDALGNDSESLKLAQFATESEPNNPLYHIYLSEFLKKKARLHRDIAENLQSR